MRASHSTVLTINCLITAFLASRIFVRVSTSEISKNCSPTTRLTLLGGSQIDSATQIWAQKRWFLFSVFSSVSMNPRLWIYATFQTMHVRVCQSPYPRMVRFWCCKLSSIEHRFRVNHIPFGTSHPLIPSLPPALRGIRKENWFWEREA